MSAPHMRLDKRAERRNHLVKVTLGVAPLAALLMARAFGADGRAIEVLTLDAHGEDRNDHIGL